MDTTAGVTGEDRVRTDRQVDYDLEDSADLWKDYGENNIDFRKKQSFGYSRELCDTINK